MLASISMRSFLLCASLAPSLVAGAAVRARTCPLAGCQSSNADSGEAGASQTSQPQEHYDYSFLEVASRSKTGCQGQTFTPAHFTCSSCDVGACKDCNNVVCDVSKCIGKFYSQECWCTKPLNPAVDKFFCDSDCTGGLCDTDGLTCKTRESACKPWWWCKLPPPKEPEGESFLQKISSHQSACAKRESSKRLNEKLDQARAHVQQLRLKARAHLQAKAVLQTSSTSGGVKKQIDAFSFAAGEWVCESALIPEPDEDPVTLAQTPAGFVVFDGRTCQGGFFKSNCFCYDKFLYLRGKDPMVTELQCDDGCGAGPCGGKTCGKEPPPPLPAPTPAPPIDPLLQELANEGMLRNYGTQMSPVT